MIPDAEIRNPRFSKKSGSQKWPSFPFVVVEKLSVFGRSRVEPLSSLRTGDHNAEMDRALWSPARRLERGSTLDRPKTVNLSTTTKGKLSHFWPPDFLGETRSERARPSIDQMLRESSFTGRLKRVESFRRLDLSN